MCAGVVGVGVEGSVHCRMFNNILGLYWWMPVDATMMITHVPRHCLVREVKLFLVENHWVRREGSGED